MKLINILLFLTTPIIVLGSYAQIAPESLHNTSISATDYVSYVVNDLEHPLYYLNEDPEISREFDLSLYFGRNTSGEDVVNVSMEGELTRSYHFYYKVVNNTKADLFIIIEPARILNVYELDFQTSQTGVGTYRQINQDTGKELVAGSIKFNLGPKVDKNSPNNWYLHGHYYFQPSSSTYVHKDSWNYGQNFIESGELVVQSDKTIPKEQLNWYKYSNAYFWNPASDVFITFEDYEKGNLNNVFKLTNSEKSELTKKDNGWYKFPEGYYQPSTSIWVKPSEVDSSPYGESIKIYFSTEPRSEYYGYESPTNNNGYKMPKIDYKHEESSEKKTNTKTGFFLSSGWLYSPEHGWIFTNQNIYPYFFLAKTNSWYCYKVDNDRHLVFDYLRQSWIENF